MESSGIRWIQCNNQQRTAAPTDYTPRHVNILLIFRPWFLCEFRMCGVSLWLVCRRKSDKGKPYERALSLSVFVFFSVVGCESYASICWNSKHGWDIVRRRKINGFEWKPNIEAKWKRSACDRAYPIKCTWVCVGTMETMTKAVYTSERRDKTISETI